YISQSKPPYGVSLNSSADHSTNFLLKPQDGVRISLDDVSISFIDVDKLIVSLRTGDLYVLTLCRDSMRTVLKANICFWGPVWAKDIQHKIISIGSRSRECEMVATEMNRNAMTAVGVVYLPRRNIDIVESQIDDIFERHNNKIAVEYFNNDLYDPVEALRMCSLYNRRNMTSPLNMLPTHFQVL
uniref:Uncharacterized protein n=1 Tax=Glossina palpalis gambiensis TaxID=67801 RepID=A0A1B0BH66_9MUSC